MMLSDRRCRRVMSKHDVGDERLCISVFRPSSDRMSVNDSRYVSLSWPTTAIDSVPSLMSGSAATLTAIRDRCRNRLQRRRMCGGKSKMSSMFREIRVPLANIFSTVSWNEGENLFHDWNSNRNVSSSTQLVFSIKNWMLSLCMEGMELAMTVAQCSETVLFNGSRAWRRKMGGPSSNFRILERMFGECWTSLLQKWRL